MEALRIWDNPDFGEVRTLEERGKVLYCGRDVARALGYSNTKDALSRHCRGVVKRDLIDNLGRGQEASFIPEGDVYRLITLSRLPRAQEFERWLFDFVAPRAVRQQLAAEAVIAAPDCVEDVLIATLGQLKVTREMAQRAEERAEEANKRIDDMTEVMTIGRDEWRKNCAALVSKIGVARGGSFYIPMVYNEIYAAFSERAGVNLSLRVQRRKQRMREMGVSKSKITNIAALDIIEEDKRFIEIYIALVKEYAVRYGVSVPATLEAKGKAALNAGTSRAASELN